MRRGRGIRLGIAMVLGVSALAVAGATWKSLIPKGREPVPGSPRVTAPTGRGSPFGLIAALRAGDPASLMIVHQRATARPDGGAEAGLSGSEAVEWMAQLTALGAGYPAFHGRAQVQAQEIVGGILARFARDGTPSGWSRLLPPSYAILSAGLSSPRAEVRASALDVVGKLWSWVPGCSMTPAEEGQVAAWKEGFYPSVLQQLKEPEPWTRRRAIACLAALPIDSKASPALLGLRDPNMAIRLQVLTSFANRPSVLTEEAILPLLHDPVPEMGALAERVLRARGLSADLIGLGRMVTDARPELRASVIPLVVQREDLDPIVWLLRLTEDRDEMVRLKAVGACAGRLTPELVQRLRELAAADDSEAVRTAAAELLPADQTVALPPLPGSPSLRHKAN